MKRPLIAIAVATLVLLAGCAGTTNPAVGTDSEGTTLRVSGTGTVTAEADRAVLEFAVVATADTAEQARADAAERSAALFDALAAAGVPESGVTTAGYWLTPTYEDSRSDPTGYRAVHAITAEVSPDEAGTVLDAAVSEAGVEVWNVRFELSTEQRAALRSQAIDAAVAEARADADAAAAATGMAVTGTQEISVGSEPIYAFRGETAQADGGTEFRPGPVTVTATVSVTYTAG